MERLPLLSLLRSDWFFLHNGQNEKIKIQTLPGRVKLVPLKLFEHANVRRLLNFTVNSDVHSGCLFHGHGVCVNCLFTKDN